MTDDTNPDFRATIAGYDPNAPAPVRITTPIARSDPFHFKPRATAAHRKHPEPELGEVRGPYVIVGKRRDTRTPYLLFLVRCACGRTEEVNENAFQKRMRRPGGPVCLHRRTKP